MTDLQYYTIFIVLVCIWYTLTLIEKHRRRY